MSSDSTRSDGLDFLLPSVFLSSIKLLEVSGGGGGERIGFVSRGEETSCLPDFFFFFVFGASAEEKHLLKTDNL